MGYPKQLFTNQDISDGFLCGLCHGVLKEPTVLDPCEHTYCWDCIVDKDGRLKYITCLIDDGFVTKAHPAQRNFISVLNDLKMLCPFNGAGCTARFKLGDYPDHDERCTFNPQNQKACAGGCGAILTKAQIRQKTHGCVGYLKQKLEARDKLIQVKQTELSTTVAELAKSQEVIWKLEQKGKEQSSRLEAEMKAKVAKDTELNAKETELKTMETSLVEKEVEIANCQERIKGLEQLYEWLLCAPQ